MESKITIRYTPKKTDYIRASRALAKKTRMFLILAAVIIFMMIVSAVVLVIPTIGNATWNNIAMVGLIVGLIYILYYLVLIPFQLSKAFNSKQHMRMARELSFTDKHVLMTIDGRSTELAWEGIQKAIYGGDFYLLINKGEERIYPYVPTRAFKDTKSLESFLQLLEVKSIPVI